MTSLERDVSDAANGGCGAAAASTEEVLRWRGRRAEAEK